MGESRRRETEETLPAVGDELREALRGYERIDIENVVKRTGHDRCKAADLLGLSPSVALPGAE